MNNFLYVFILNLLLSVVMFRILLVIIRSHFWIFSAIGFLSMGYVSYFIIRNINYPYVNVWLGLGLVVTIFGTVVYAELLYGEIEDYIIKLRSKKGEN